MLDVVVTLFFGWPAILASVVISGMGLFRNKYQFLVVAAVLAFGPCWFLSGFPVVSSPVFLAPLFLFGAGFLLSRGHEMLCWLVALPYYLLVLLLFYVILAQA
jgi:hypothetical protein